MKLHTGVTSILRKSPCIWVMYYREEKRALGCGAGWQKELTSASQGFTARWNQPRSETLTNYYLLTLLPSFLPELIISKSSQRQFLQKIDLNKVIRLFL
jgi:hypothetical protein